MIKLTRSGWNNVIIFAVMGFIALIHLTQSDKFALLEEKGVEQESYLVGEHGVILSMTVNQQTHIERIGQTWRAIPAVLTGQPLDAMMGSWHQVKGRIIAKPDHIDKSKAIIVSLLLAGEAEIEYFMLFPNKQELIVYRQQSELWISLPIAFFNQLIPQAVLI